MVLVQMKSDKLQQKKDKQTIKNRTINNKFYFLTPPSVCYIIPFCVTCDGHESHRNNLKNDCMDSDVHVKSKNNKFKLQFMRHFLDLTL